MATSTALTYRVTSISDAQNGKVVVSFAQVSNNGNGNANIAFAGNLNLTLDSEEAKAYWPGEDYTLSLESQ